MINIDQLILDATKSKSNVERDTYRLIKAKFMEYSTSKEGAKTPINEAIQLTILTKIAKELSEDIEIYKNVKPDLAEEAYRQLEIVDTLLPEEVSPEEIAKTIEEYIATNGKYTQKEMGKIIKILKQDFPTADGKALADMVKSYL